MAEPQVESLLAQDFDALTERYQRDGFERDLLFKLDSKRRIRMGIIVFAGGIGAALAATQSYGFIELLSSQMAEEAQTPIAFLQPEMLAAMALAVVASASVFLMQRDL